MTKREMERWRLAMARRLWVEASGGDEALHHSTERERERERERESNERENEKKLIFFL